MSSTAGIEMTISPEKVFVPNSLGKLAVLYKGHEFFVLDTTTNQKFKIERADLSKDLRGIQEDQLIGCLKSSYLAVKRIGEDYGIQLNYRLPGGGPISGAIAYWVTKSAAYGAIIGAATAAVVGTGSAVVGAVGGASALTGGSAVAGATGVAGTVATATGGAVAGVVAKSAAASAVVAETTGAVVATGGIAAVTAGIETAALSASVFFGALPFLP